MTNELGNSVNSQPPAPVRGNQLTLFPGMEGKEVWERLSSPRIRLDKQTYLSLRESYQEVFESFLPGPRSAPFYTQVAEQLKKRGVQLSPQTVGEIVRRGRNLGEDLFPDPRKRSVRSSSPAAARLQTPGAPLRMSQEEHNAFAKVYRELLKAGYPKRKKGKGFYAEAAIRLRDFDHQFTERQLNSYAQYRRRIGDVNFPRLRGSHETERMHVAAVDRIQALGVMASGLMHEILQPLQIIRADAELQKQEQENGAIDQTRLKQRLDTIIRQVETISTVVQHVRTIARAGDPKTGPVKFQESVNNALTLFRKQLQSRGISVDLDGIPPDVPDVHADSVALERIFVNLLLNARDAIEEAGRGEGKIQIAAHVKDKAVICEVTDDGTGIAPENISRVFDPYFTTKEVGKGTGLGLTEVMNLMIQFGGRVTVKSTPEKGATFTLEFQKHAEEN